MRLRSSQDYFTNRLTFRDKKTGKILGRCRQLDGMHSALEMEIFESMLFEIESNIGVLTQAEKDFVATELHRFIWK